jgi:hypothetical protein
MNCRAIAACLLEISGIAADVTMPAAKGKLLVNWSPDWRKRNPQTCRSIRQTLPRASLALNLGYGR